MARLLTVAILLAVSFTGSCFDESKAIAPETFNWTIFECDDVPSNATPSDKACYKTVCNATMVAKQCINASWMAYNASNYANPMAHHENLETFTTGVCACEEAYVPSLECIPANETTLYPKAFFVSEYLTIACLAIALAQSSMQSAIWVIVLGACGGCCVCVCVIVAVMFCCGMIGGKKRSLASDDVDEEYGDDDTPE